jgi:hypothetical protein
MSEEEIKRIIIRLLLGILSGIIGAYLTILVLL